MCTATMNIYFFTDSEVVICMCRSLEIYFISKIFVSSEIHETSLYETSWYSNI